MQSSNPEKTDEQQQVDKREKKTTSKFHDNEVKKNDKKITNDRRSQLLEWKAEKERKKKLEAKKKRPTFQIYSVPRHNYYSPPARVLPSRMNNKKQLASGNCRRKSQNKLSTSKEQKEVAKASVTTEEPVSSLGQDSGPSSSSSSSSSSSQTVTATPKEELKVAISSSTTFDDDTAPQTPTTDLETSTEFEISSSSSSSSMSSPSSTTSDTSTLSMEVPSSSTTTTTLQSKLASTSNSQNNATGLMNPLIAKIHQSLVLQENKNLQDICTDWTQIQKECDMPADDIRYVNSAIGQMNFLLRRESNRFHNVIAGYQAGVQVFIRGRDFPRL